MAGPAAGGQIEGRNPVLEALRGGLPVARVLLARGDRHGAVREILALARARGVPVEEVAPEELARRATTRVHQGVIAEAAPRGPVAVEDLLAEARRRGEPPFLVLAAEVQDPQNLGSLLRSAEAAGAHGVVVPRHRSARLTPAVIKASAGAAAHLAVAETPNLARCLEGLKERGLWVCGADPGAERAYYEADLRGPLVVVVGSEGRGIPRLVREKCDFLVRIPMGGRVASLNVAVAAAIILFEARRQRQG